MSGSIGIQKLEHYTINTTDVAGTVKFYENAIGLKNGDRPAFDFPGAWLYCAETPVVHLIGVDSQAAQGTGTLDHIAFRAGDYRSYQKRLRQQGIPFTERDVPGMTLHQMFLKDPVGVTIELNFWDE